MKRTAKDFVRKLFKEGKSPEHIRSVAKGSYWHNQMDEIEKWIEYGKKKKKKLTIRKVR